MSHGVLIIDDDVDVRRSARLVLASHDTRVEELPTPQGLEVILDQSRIEVVLLDMNFMAGARDGAGGLDALARVRSIDPTLAVVLMTAYGGVNLAVESLKRGAVDFILKPWWNDKLLRAVTAAAEITRERRAAEVLELASVERRTIERALERFRGNISVTAAALGISRAALYRRMAKHGLS